MIGDVFFDGTKRDDHHGDELIRQPLPKWFPLEEWVRVVCLCGRYEAWLRVVTMPDDRIALRCTACPGRADGEPTARAPGWGLA